METLIEGIITEHGQILVHYKNDWITGQAYDGDQEIDAGEYGDNLEELNFFSLEGRRFQLVKNYGNILTHESNPCNKDNFVWIDVKEV